MLTCRKFSSQFSSVAQSCLTLCDPMDCNTPGFPAHHQLLELAQTHVHQVGNAIQPSHPLSSPSPPALNLFIPILHGNIYLIRAFSHSVVSFVTSGTSERQASLSITNFQSLLKLISIKSVMPSNHLIPCYPLLFLPSIFPSIRAFSSESVLRIRWPKYWSYSFSISPSSEYSGLISFKMDWFTH